MMAYSATLEHFKRVARIRGRFSFIARDGQIEIDPSFYGEKFEENKQNGMKIKFGEQIERPYFETLEEAARHAGIVVSNYISNLNTMQSRYVSTNVRLLVASVY